MVNEKALELLKDKDFLLELGKAANVEEAQEKFQSKGTDITIEELLALRAAVKQNSGEKLTDDELMAVTGGGGVEAAKAVKNWVLDLGDTVNDMGHTIADKNAWKSFGDAFLDIFSGW